MASLTRQDITYLKPDETTSSIELIFTKASGSRWDITDADGKRVWIGTVPVPVVRVDAPYKPGDAPRITLPRTSPATSEIEGAAYDWMKASLVDSIIGGTKMTRKTIEAMTVDPGSHVKCGMAECTFFDARGLEVPPYPIETGASYLFAIQPASLWYFKKQIGLKWYIRQVRKPEDEHRIKTQTAESTGDGSDWSI